MKHPDPTNLAKITIHSPPASALLTPGPAPEAQSRGEGGRKWKDAVGGEDGAGAEGRGGLFPAFEAVAVVERDWGGGGGAEVHGAALAADVHHGGVYCFALDWVSAALRCELNTGKPLNLPARLISTANCWPCQAAVGHLLTPLLTVAIGMRMSEVPLDAARPASSAPISKRPAPPSSPKHFHLRLTKCVNNLLEQLLYCGQQRTICSHDTAIRDDFCRPAEL